MSVIMLEGCPVRFSKAAMNRFKTVIDEMRQKPDLKDEDIWVRIGIDSTGVSGVHPILEFDITYGKFRHNQQIENTEYVVGGLQIVIMNRWVKYLKGLFLDYQEGLNKSGFAFSSS